MINWTSKGLVSPCCMDHYEALPYGECKSHPKIQFCDTKSLIAFTIHKDLNVLGVTMFHDFTWRDKSFDNHLNNTAIFETFPINVAAFYEGKMIPDYSIIKKPIPTSFNQIDWLFPRNYHSMYYGNWDMKESLQKIIPIIENWNNVKSYVKTTLHHQSLLTQTANKLSASNKKIEVIQRFQQCFCIGFIWFLLLLFLCQCPCFWCFDFLCFFILFFVFHVLYFVCFWCFSN